jgi:hypothetical protein
MNHLLLIELNTRCWLREVSGAGCTESTLASVPDRVFDEWARCGVTHVWLMGVWTTGPLSRRRALSHPGLRALYDQALPGWREPDVAGSPYAIGAYTVPESLGGLPGLRAFRRRLHQQGLRLLLDFVPNHLGLDHPWVGSHPEYFVPGPPGHPDAVQCETRFGKRWLMHGKDPNFPPWDDTVQLDYRQVAVRQAMQTQLLEIADCCDGVRCDMAMLLLREVFESNWRDFPPAGPGSGSTAVEFWRDAVVAVKARYPEFLFLAEVYWGLEERLQELGFDYTYDKCLTDGLLGMAPAQVVRHLQSKPPEFIRHSAHFLENHDEERVAARLDLDAHRAAALAILGLPGMRLLYDGQTSGAKLRTPVQLGRRMALPADPAVEKLYADLLTALNHAGVGQGVGRVVSGAPAWPDNPTWENLLLIRWDGGAFPLVLIVVNMAGHRSQCRVVMDPLPSGPPVWDLMDLLGAERWRRADAELRSPGLFLDVAAHAAQVFVLRPNPTG